MNLQINKKSFLYSFFGVFIVGNTVVSLFQRSELMKKFFINDSFHYTSAVNLVFLFFSFLLVIFISLQLKMKRFLYFYLTIFPLLCFLTFFLFGFFSPFSFGAYWINLIINNSAFPTFSVTR